MASATLVSPAAVVSHPGAPARWIISKREDVTWFIGSSLAGYLALALIASGFPIFPIQFVWFFLVDGPHVLSTVTRTYCDRAERAKLGNFLWIPIPLMLIGPAMALVGQAKWFFLLAVCWQQFHVVKQHFGFMMLYKAKNRDRDRMDFLLDRWFLLMSLFVPLGWFVLQTTPALHALPLKWLPDVAFILYGTLAAFWMLRQAVKLRTGAAMNWPKLWLLAAVVPLQWLAWTYALRYAPDGVLVGGIILGLFHGLQYHRLMWLHNSNRYSASGASERHGLAVVLAANAGRYLAVGIGLHFLTYFLPQALFPGQVMLQTALWGIPFAHYCLDARIWHVRSDKGLAAAIGMA